MPSFSPFETAVLDAIDPAPMLGQVERWCAVNSGTGNLDGLASMAELLADAFGALPGEVGFVDAPPEERVLESGEMARVPRGRHMVLAVRPQAKRRMILTGHMDTVFAADHPFQNLAWIDSDTINAPGSADMKGGLAVMLAALKAVEAAGAAGAHDLSDFGYDVMINSDEETGSATSRDLIAKLAPGKIAAFTYEPALPDGTLAGARGGSGNFAITIRGVSAHAGRNPDEGRNAVVAAADLALRLKALHRAGLSVNPSRIDGGGPTNVVPDLALLRVNFRPKGPQDEREAAEAVARLAREITREHEVEAVVHGGFSRPPKPIDAAAQKLFGLVKSCGADLGLDIAWRDTGGVCDGNNIAACGVPVVDTMGARGGAIHSAQEFMIVSSLEERARLSALAIARLIEKGQL